MNKEIQSGTVAKVTYEEGLPIMYEKVRKYFPIYEEVLVIYDFATAPF